MDDCTTANTGVRSDNVERDASERGWLELVSKAQRVDSDAVLIASEFHPLVNTMGGGGLLSATSSQLNNPQTRMTVNV
jgi:hypothetical protein